MAINIIIADNNQIMRQGLKALLEKESDMEVVAEAGGGQVTLRMVRELRPEVVIIDIKMPISDGIEATRQILSESPGTKVIALSMHGERHFVTKMLKAGATGYLLKDCAFEELPKAIRVAVSNKTFLSSGLAEIIAKK